MSLRAFRLKTFLYVTPADSASLALSYMKKACDEDRELHRLSPDFRMTDVPGKIEVIFHFSAMDIAAAENVATDRLELLLNIINHQWDENSVREGSNSLSFA